MLRDEEAYRPDRRGFDETFIHGGGGIGQTYPGSCGDAPNNGYFDPAILHNGRFVRTKGYCTDVFFGQARKWIADRSAERRRFFAYITPNAPHDPFISPGADYDRLFAGKGLKTNEIAYYSMIRNIDENVGKLLDDLQTMGLERETLVIFMTDNGHSVRSLFNAGMRAAKGSVYQGGIRAPSFWRWPGEIRVGDRPQLAAHIDVFPTLAEIAGIKLDDRLSAQVEGRSLAPILRNPQQSWPDRYLIAHRGRWAAGKAGKAKHDQAAIRNGRFKLVNNRELYDLKNDPGESRNVIEEHPEEVVAMRAEYDRWWDKILAKVKENEMARGPRINPFKELYWKQFGGGPSNELLEKMHPEKKFQN